MSDNDKVASSSPIKKNKTGKIINVERRIIVINTYKTNLRKYPDMPFYKMVELIADSMAIGKTTVNKVIKQYKETKTITVPKTKRAKKSIIDTISELDKDTIRAHIHKMQSAGQILTVDKVLEVVSADNSLPQISRTNLYRLLKSLDLNCIKRGRKRTLIKKKKRIIK